MVIIILLVLALVAAITYWTFGGFSIGCLVGGHILSRYSGRCYWCGKSVH